MPWDWDQHSSPCRRLGVILWGLIRSPSPLPPFLPSQLCYWNYPEEIFCVTQSWNCLWELLRWTFELFINKEEGQLIILLWKKWQEMAHAQEEWLPQATPREHSGSQIRWDNQWLYNSLQIHTLPLQEKIIPEHNFMLLLQTQVSLQSAWRSKVTHKPRVTYFLEG